MLLGEELQIDAKSPKFKLNIFESTLYMKSGSMPLNLHTSSLTLLILLPMLFSVLKCITLLYITDSTTCSSSSSKVLCRLWHFRGLGFQIYIGMVISDMYSYIMYKTKLSASLYQLSLKNYENAAFYSITRHKSMS